LLQRVIKTGGDSRFNKLKKKVGTSDTSLTSEPTAFFGFWVGQATWVSLVALPVFAVNAIPPALQPALCWKDFFGIAVWVTGFLTEVIADRQKSQWRKERDAKEHNEEWITRGLWAKSRHPNYFGMKSHRQN